MDPPAESGTAPAKDKTSKSFSDQTTQSFSDRTSVTPILQPRAKIVLWGDSLTQTCFEGWGAKLANRYQRRADIINRGMSGYNTKWYLQLPNTDRNLEDCSTSNVALCTIWFGANDASLEEWNPHHYVSLEEYSENLQLLVEKAKKVLKNPPILLITAPPVHHGQRFEYQKERYGDKATGVLERTLENSGKYAEACEKVATKLGLPCLNLWQAMQEEPATTTSNNKGDDDKDAHWARYLSDGLHFSPAGHDFVFDRLVSKIQQEFPHLHVEPCALTGQACNSGSTCTGLDTFGPYHDQIDSKDPEVAMKQVFKDFAAKAKAASAVGSTSIDSGMEQVVVGNSPSLKKPKMDAP